MHKPTIEGSIDVDALKNAQQTGTTCDQEKSTSRKENCATKSSTLSKSSSTYPTSPTRNAARSISEHDEEIIRSSPSMSSRRKDDNNTLSFTIYTITGGSYSVKCREVDTFRSLQFKLFAKTGMCPDHQKIIMNDKELFWREGMTLVECGIVNGSRLTLVVKMGTGFHIQARPSIKSLVRKPLNVSQELPVTPSKKREVGWWKQKQEEHKGMKAKMDELKEKLAAMKALK